MRFVTFLLSALMLFASAAFATPQGRDLTDLWIDPAESGWGLNIFHQGDTLFASLFVYGADGQPKWYTASALTGAASYSGSLTEATGPWLGGPFDPAAVSRRTVGSMTVAFNVADDSMNVDYTIDGVHVVKTVHRFTFSRTNLEGTFVGNTYERQSGGFQIRRDQVMAISDDGTNVTLFTRDAALGNCTWSGAHSQGGQYESVAGTYTCGSKTGSWSMRVDPTTEGFTGAFYGNELQAGKIAASRSDGSRMLGNGYRNALWFPPNEGGWGLNTIEQGDTLFGTLFVYDAQQRPHWYSASSLQRVSGSGETATYSGALVESTGPYYGTAFNAAAVNRRIVGTMTLTTGPGAAATLSYTVDGVAVEKQVTRFAFRKNAFTGTYAGHFMPDAAGIIDSVTATIDDADNFLMQTTTATDGTCSYVAPLSQTGHLRAMNGTFSCTSGRSGNFTMSNATVSLYGFTSRLRMDPSFSGRFEGVRLGPLQP